MRVGGGNGLRGKNADTLPADQAAHLLSQLGAGEGDELKLSVTQMRPQNSRRSRI
jgi:hypothetical protein